MLLKENCGPTWEAGVCPVRPRNTWDWVVLFQPGRRWRSSAYDPITGSLGGSGLCVNLGSTPEGNTPYLPLVSCKPFS